MKVTLVLNGKAIASTQKKIKALLEEEEKKKIQKSTLSEINIQSIESSLAVKAGGAALIATGFMGGNGDKDMQMEDGNDILEDAALDTGGDI